MTNQPVQLLDAKGNPITGSSNVTGQARLVNPLSALGGEADKTVTISFQDVVLKYGEADTLYRHSWAAAKMIDIPVDDMWRKGRTFTDADDGLIEAMEDAQEDLHVLERVPDTQKLARLHGTGMLVVVVEGQELEDPLDVDRIPEGGINNFLVVGRDAIEIENYVGDVHIPGFGEPWQYRIDFGSQLSSGYPANIGDPMGVTHGYQLVHASRCIRFDGVAPLATAGWYSKVESDWGVSTLCRAVQSIHIAAQMHNSVNHLVEESSILWLKAFGLKMSGRAREGETTIQELTERLTMRKSMFRTLVMSDKDDVGRVEASMAGYRDILNHNIEVLAIIAGIPKTRFLASSPDGMNATGESDANNYAMMVSSDRKRNLGPVMRRKVDLWLAKHVGAKEPPETTWPPVHELSEKQQAEIAEKTVNALSKSYADGAINEEEYREGLRKLEMFGDLDEDWMPPEPDPLEMMQQGMSQGNGRANGQAAVAVR